MNTQIRTLGIVLMVLFSALFVQLNNLQVFSANRLNNHPANTRTVVRDFSQPRGAIQTSDGVVIAESVEVDDAFERQRRYPLKMAARCAQLAKRVNTWRLSERSASNVCRDGALAAPGATTIPVHRTHFC